MNTRLRLSLFVLAAALITAASLIAQGPTIDATIQLHGLPVAATGAGDRWIPMLVGGVPTGANATFSVIGGYTRQVRISLNGVEMLQANQLAAGALPNIAVV